MGNGGTSLTLELVTRFQMDNQDRENQTAETKRLRSSSPESRRRDPGRWQADHTVQRGPTRPPGHRERWASHRTRYGVELEGAGPGHQLPSGGLCQREDQVLRPMPRGVATAVNPTKESQGCRWGNPEKPHLSQVRAKPGEGQEARAGLRLTQGLICVCLKVAVVMGSI